MWSFKQIKFHYEKSPDVFKFIAAIYNKTKVAAIRLPYIILNLKKNFKTYNEFDSPLPQTHKHTHTHTNYI
jgi:hypothetical protein